MLRIVEYRGARSDLDDLAEIHHRHAVRHAFDHGHVVRDEQIGQAHARLQIKHQVDDLRLDRHVERRDRFVGDDQLRLERQRARDADALALAAGELVREALRHLGLKADAPQEVRHLVARLGASGELMHEQRFGDRRADAEARVEAGEGVLEDHLRAASHVAQRALPEIEHVLAVDDDGAALGFDQPHDGAAGR